MDAAEIDTLCKARRWSRARLMLELRKAARAKETELPPDESLRRMIREWANGRRGLSTFYAELLSAVFGVQFRTGKPGEQGKSNGINLKEHDELTQRLASAAAVDRDLVVLLENQTQTYRLLDRRLGARRLLAQTELHLAHITDLLAYSQSGQQRQPLAAAAAEAAALAGWQALDLGEPDRAWRLHETAKHAARESGNPTVLGHVSAQQGYVLLDLDQAEQAIGLMRQAREDAGSRVPDVVRSWLWAAEAEALAGAGRELEARRALEAASQLLPADAPDPTLPFVVLDATHLGRWRGHCLARLGADEAVDELSAALARLDPSFTRAAAGLHTDLALARSVRGEHDAAYMEARLASDLASQTASARQQRRIRRLLKDGEARSGR